ncbi:MAG: flavoprotein [Planctomycetota bacterium]
MAAKNQFKGKEVAIGVTGSIAAYKTAEIVSYLSQQGANVTVVMTAGATKFVTPLTFQTLSHHKVITDLFSADYEFDPPRNNRDSAAAPQHIALAEKLDALLIAPASGNIIGKIASGIADDALSTLVMSVKASRVIIAPAMNERMYLNPIVQDNIKRLKKQGYHFIEPAKGHLVCGSGIGRLADLDTIITYLSKKV